MTGVLGLLMPYQGYGAGGPPDHFQGKGFGF